LPGWPRCCCSPQPRRGRGGRRYPHGTRRFDRALAGRRLDVVADRAGFYKQQHLNVVIQLVNSPSAARRSSRAARGHLRDQLRSRAAGLREGPAPAVLLHQGRAALNVLAVLDDSPIHSLDDFKGKNIGVFNVGSAGEVTAQLILAGAGLRKDDVTFSRSAPERRRSTRSSTIGSTRSRIRMPRSSRWSCERISRCASGATRPCRTCPRPPTPRRPKPSRARPMRSGASPRHRRSGAVRRDQPGRAARMFLAASHARSPTPTSRSGRVRSSCCGRPARDRPAHREDRRALRAADAALRAGAGDYGMTKTVVPVDQVITNRFIDAANDFDHRAVIALAENWPKSTP